MADLQPAAIFRVEGTLVAPAAMPAPAYFTMNAREMSRRVTRLGGLALAAGMRLASPLKDRPRVHRMAWMGLRGMSEDRLAVLGAEYYERHVLPRVRPIGLDLVREARRQGRRVVLMSELLDVIVAPLQAHVGAGELHCNSMEIDRGEATGRLRDPVIGGPVSGQWAKRWAREAHVDLDRSAGYGACSADSLLLSAVGHPCAVYPDRRLRRIARDLDWPIVEG